MTSLLLAVVMIFPAWHARVPLREVPAWYNSDSPPKAKDECRPVHVEWWETCHEGEMLFYRGEKGYECCSARGRCPVCGAKTVEVGMFVPDCIGLCADCAGCGPKPIEVRRCPHDGLLFTTPEQP